MPMSTLLPVDVRFAARTLVLDPPLTDAELEELCRANDIVQIERTREGVIQMNPPPGGMSSRSNFEISRQLGAWWIVHERGEVFDSSGGFYLPDGSMLSPDAAYYWVWRLSCFRGVLRYQRPSSKAAHLRETARGSSPSLDYAMNRPRLRSSSRRLTAR